MTNSPEQQPKDAEQSNEKMTSAAEQLEKLANLPEISAEKVQENAEKAAEKAKIEAREVVASIETQIEKTPEPSAPVRRGPMSKKQREANFKKTIKQVQEELNPVSRTFSKIIHTKAVEKISDVVGSTIARPNALLAGAVAAFVLTLIVYVIAKIIGYQLSGFESIAAFIIGWVLGIIYDYLRAIVTGKK